MDATAEKEIYQRRAMTVRVPENERSGNREVSAS